MSACNILYTPAVVVLEFGRNLAGLVSVTPHPFQDQVAAGAWVTARVQSVLAAQTLGAAQGEVEDYLRRGFPYDAAHAVARAFHMTLPQGMESPAGTYGHAWLWLYGNCQIGATPPVQPPAEPVAPDFLAGTK